MTVLSWFHKSSFYTRSTNRFYLENPIPTGGEKQEALYFAPLDPSTGRIPRMANGVCTATMAQQATWFCRNVREDRSHGWKTNHRPIGKLRLYQKWLVNPELIRGKGSKGSAVLNNKPRTPEQQAVADACDARATAKMCGRRTAPPTAKPP